MYNKILVPMALDHGISEKTLNIAKVLAGDTGKITALHVYEAPQGSVQAFLDEEAKQEAMSHARAELTSKTSHLDGVEAKMVVGHTYRSIVDYASAEDVDCIVMGSHKPGFSDFLLGSTAARVVRHAGCAVHVYRTT